MANGLGACQHGEESVSKLRSRILYGVNKFRVHRSRMFPSLVRNAEGTQSQLDSRMSPNLSVHSAATSTNDRKVTLVILDLMSPLFEGERFYASQHDAFQSAEFAVGVTR